MFGASFLELLANESPIERNDGSWVGCSDGLPEFKQNLTLSHCLLRPIHASFCLPFSFFSTPFDSIYPSLLYSYLNYGDSLFACHTFPRRCSVLYLHNSTIFILQYSKIVNLLTVKKNARDNVNASILPWVCFSWAEKEW